MSGFIQPKKIMITVLAAALLAIAMWVHDLVFAANVLGISGLGIIAIYSLMVYGVMLAAGGRI